MILIHKSVPFKVDNVIRDTGGKALIAAPRRPVGGGNAAVSAIKRIKEQEEEEEEEEVPGVTTARSLDLLVHVQSHIGISDGDT
ncbi:hypothetical protein L3Q82_003957 [Scortum barcoo]|uniref:Uncharacterized protein n=1 Tax=Scortum barcoo TaxID=214431 RepID=A0ACB8X6Y3_9TELE|nr:hypothetical protein L3Q82_003957 [Scortum barcoo]